MELLWWHWILIIVVMIPLVLIFFKLKAIWNKKLRPQMKIIKLPYYLSESNAGKVIFLKYYDIKKINGLLVDDYSLGIAGSGAMLLPPGKHNIIFDYVGELYVNETMKLKGSDFTINVQVEAGCKYVLKSEVLNKKLRPVSISSYLVKINSEKELSEYFDDGNQGYEIYNKYKESLKKMDSLILQNQNDAQAYYTRGVLKFNIGDYKEANSDFAKAIELEPGNNEYKNMFDSVNKSNKEHLTNSLIGYGLKILDGLS